MLENKIIKTLADKTNKQDRFGKNKLNTIYDLYGKFVLNSPAFEKSIYAKKFVNYGLIEPYHYKRLLKEIDNKMIVKNVELCYIERHFNEEELSLIDMNISKKDKEVFLYRISGPGKTDSLFSSIRNSIAHGSFILKNKYIEMWTLTTKGRLSFYAYIDFKKLDIIWNELQNFS